MTERVSKKATRKAGMTTGAKPYAPYSAYKDSGVEWLGKIPAHWQVKRLKEFAAVQLSNVDKKSVEGQSEVWLCNYLDVYYNETVAAGIDFMQATAAPEQTRRFSLRTGDVLITKDSETWTDIAVPAVVTEDLPHVLCGYHLALIRPDAECDGVFLSRCITAIGPRDQFQLAANGITRFGLTGHAIRNGVLAVPPHTEQRLIAAFLDRETAKIDALVAKKERLIELLQEKRAALITQAVTKGLDPAVQMKDSGIKWIGYIPVHWNVKKLKHMVPAVTVGIVVTPSKYYVTEGVPCLRSLNIAQGHVERDDLVFISETANLLHRKSRIFEGDIVVVRTGRAGVAAVVPPYLDGANCIDLLIIRRSSQIDSHFLYYFMNSRAVGAQVSADSVGSIQEHYNTVTLSNLCVPSIPATEQRAIVAFLDRETARMDALVNRVRAAIDHLKELRTALISAAVTGKIDVRDEADPALELTP